MAPFTSCSKTDRDDTNMKSIRKILVATMAALLLMGVSARAGTYPSATLDETIPTGVGIYNTLTSSGEVGTISSVTVNLDITGGINGALYGYLSYNGVIVTLLNQPGTGPGNPLGNMNSGFSVTISDSGSVNINSPTGNTTSPVTGTYNVNGTVGNNGSAAFGSAYGGDNPNGTWTLYLENDISGSGSSELVSWGITIDAVPEPTNIALGIFGVCAVAGRLRAGWKKSRASAKSIEERK
jgi:hypothetical protein